MASEPLYPVYIISKGRSYNPMTANIFEANGINYFVAVEPYEYDNYVEKLGSKRVLKLPFENLGLGSYPARNYCWHHSIKNGASKHWIFDDNITAFKKWIDGKRKVVNDQVKEALCYVERYSDMFDIDCCGFEEPNFSVKPPKKPFKRNCHVYSAMLIKNSIPYRWRLKYNEDVDLNLQILHNGGKTASCIYFLADKISTSAKMKGGNQDELYKGNDPKKKLLKAKMLESVWPKYVKTVIRFNRYHHLVDWTVFSKKNTKAKK